MDFARVRAYGNKTTMGKVLTVVHQENSTWGKVGEALMERGYELDRRCPCIGDALPETLDAYDAAVVFGGPQSANDDDVPGIRAELDWLEQCALPAGTPLLGICLGAQQIARVLGAKVGPHSDGLVEIGYWPVRPTQAGAHFLDGLTHFYQWHSETFAIPSDAVHLAENDAFQGQAFSYQGNTFAIEFHPEMTFEMVSDWSTSEGGSAKIGLRGAQCHEEQMACYGRYADGSANWLNYFIDELFLPTENRSKQVSRGTTRRFVDTVRVSR